MCVNHETNKQLDRHRTVYKSDDVAQWFARLTRTRWMPGKQEFEFHQKLPLFPWALYIQYELLDLWEFSLEGFNCTFNTSNWTCGSLV